MNSASSGFAKRLITKVTIIDAATPGKKAYSGVTGGARKRYHSCDTKNPATMPLIAPSLFDLFMKSAPMIGPKKELARTCHV